MPHYMELTPLLATLLLFLCCSCEPEYRAKCSNNTETITSMTPSDDGVQSRYTVEWCTNLKEHDTVWNLELAYNRRNPKACDNKNQHSTKTIHLHDLKLNCSQVCLSTDLDLIFSTCYRVQSLLPSRGSLRDVSTHNISNNYTLDTFKNATYEGNIVNHGDYVSAHFFLGIIPVTSFDMELCKKTNNSCHGYCECMDVKRNCSATVSTQRHEVECRVPAPPGFYELRMRHLAPWASSDFASDKKNMHLSFSVQRPTDVRAPDAGAVGCGGAGRAACGPTC